MPYRSNPRLADLLLQQGDIAAQRAMAGGQAWGNAVSSIGNRVGSTITAMQQQKANAPRQAMQDEMDQLSIEGKRRQFAAEDRQLSEQDQAQAVMKVSDWLTEIASAPDPETQAATYQAGRAALLESGIFTPQDAPEFFPGQSWVKAKMMRTLPAAERFKQLYPTDKAPDGFTLSEGQTRFGPDGKQVANVPKPVEPKTAPNPTEASLAAAAAQGDKSAIEALRLLRGQQAKPQGPQPAWQWVMRDGKEVYTNRINAGDRPQNARVKATEDERKTAGFYGQMSDAVQLIDALEDTITQKELYQIQTLPHEKLIGMVNRNELSENAKRYLRAFEQFTESRLRPVSGAAIADSEYARDRRTYAKQYGETPALATDRKNARKSALSALKKRAGVALDEANDSGTVRLRAPDGKEQDVPAEQADHYISRGATVVKP